MASVYTITTGETLNTHKSFKSRLPWGSCKNVSNITDCDVILAFCPVTSRVGTDIEAALRAIPEGKPLALVVLHHTFDSNYTLPDTKRFMKRPGCITVNCLFSDDGLMRCPCNDDAVRAVAKFLQQHGKRSPRGKLGLGLLMLILLCVAISNFREHSVNSEHSELIHTKKELELIQQEYKKLEGKLNKTINSLEEEVENYKELNSEAKKEMNSLKEEVENCKESDRKAKKDINSLKEEVENYKELDWKANEKINSLEEEVENYKELNSEAKKEMNSLKEEVENCKESDRKAKKDINYLKEEVENYKELHRKANKKIISLKEEVESCKELERKANKNINYKLNEGKVNEKIESLKPISPSVENSLKRISLPDEVFSGLEGDTEKQEDKSSQLPCESSQNLEIKASHDTAVARNDEMDEKDKKSDKKAAINLIYVTLILSILILSGYSLYVIITTLATTLTTPPTIPNRPTTRKNLSSTENQQLRLDCVLSPQRCLPGSVTTDLMAPNPNPSPILAPSRQLVLKDNFGSLKHQQPPPTRTTPIMKNLSSTEDQQLRERQGCNNPYTPTTPSCNTPTCPIPNYPTTQISLEDNVGSLKHQESPPTCTTPIMKNLSSTKDQQPRKRKRCNNPNPPITPKRPSRSTPTSLIPNYPTTHIGLEDNIGGLKHQEPPHTCTTPMMKKISSTKEQQLRKRKRSNNPNLPTTPKRPKRNNPNTPTPPTYSQANTEKQDTTTTAISTPTHSQTNSNTEKQDTTTTPISTPTHSQGQKKTGKKKNKPHV
ncbi:proteoglycan 4-like isoform X2 [Alosa sapidissima]|uniref:proteoglycan 4-like isoform X2 n=1 Tax=Alosa sapidissima TaxID=34773 RepID=UPI001C0A2E27|nr:proteoglycan 4-like isoform X2 [Alosa sapidissima]